MRNMRTNKPKPPPDPVAGLIDAGFAEFEAGDMAAALVHWESAKAIVEGPGEHNQTNRAIVWFNMGVAHGNLGNHERAMFCYAAALRINPDCRDSEHNYDLLAYGKSPPWREVDKRERKEENRLCHGPLRAPRPEADVAADLAARRALAEAKSRANGEAIARLMGWGPDGPPARPPEGNGNWYQKTLARIDKRLLEEKRKSGGPVWRLSQEEFDSLLAKKIAHRLARQIPMMAPGEIESAAMLGLVEAARAYRPGANVSFTTFATFRIKGAVLDERRASDVLSRDERLKVKNGQAKAPTHSEFEAEGAGDIGVSPPSVYDVVAAVSLEQRLRRLTLRQARVVREHVLRDRTLAAVGADLGVTESRACQLFGEAVRRLRVLMTDRHSPEYATLTPVEKNRVSTRLSQVKHRESAAIRKKRWAEQNREHLAAYRRRWAEQNRERVRERERERYRLNLEASRARARANAARSYANQPREGKRRCSKCHQPGHNVRRCGRPTPPHSPPAPRAPAPVAP